MKEMEWKICPLWTDYQISEHGDIRRHVKARGGFIGARKPYVAANGRLMIVMRSPGKSKACHVSRLVAEAFIGLPASDKHQCAHNDGNPMNNHYTNLRWATISENQMDRVVHGTSNRGERFGRARLTEAQVLKIKADLLAGVRTKDIAAEYDVAETTIKSIKQRKSWSWLSLACHTEGRPFPAPSHKPEGALL